MATNELIAKLRKYLDLDRQNQERKRDKLHALLKKLKKKQKALEAKLENTTDGKKRKQIKRDLKVLYVQRKKGVKLCRSISCKD